MTATPQAQQANARVDRLEGVRTSRPQSAPLARAERVESLRARIEARTDAQAAREFRATVAEARQHVRGWAAEKAVSAKTADRYGRAVDAMQVKGEKPEDARCRASYDFRRAALVHETRKDIKSALTEVDRAQRQGDIKRAAAAFNRVRDGLETLRKYPPSTGNREADLQRSSVYSGPRQADQDRSNGKRGSLASLPEDWRDQVAKANHVERSCRPNTPTIRCTSNCVNGNCVVTYENGCKMRVQVAPRFDSFQNNWVYPSPSC